jgi:peroxiredoxin
LYYYVKNKQTKKKDFLAPLKQCKTKLLQLTSLKKSLTQLNVEVVLVYKETEREIKKSPLKSILDNFLCVNDSKREMSKHFHVENSTFCIFLIDKGDIFRSKK